jgi:uncharacterized protein YuzE
LLAALFAASKSEIKFHEADTITFRKATVTTKHLAEGIAAAYDSEGHLAGIEILDAIKRFGDRDTMSKFVFEGIDPAVAVIRGTPA